MDMDGFCGRSMSLFGLYMEVGEVKRSPVEVDGCVFVEVWLASFASSPGKRTECKTYKRRPIYSVLEQIKELIGDREACVLFLCDDGRDETVSWGDALALLWHHLKKTAKYAVVFTKESKEQLDMLGSANRYLSEDNTQLALSFFAEADAIVTERSNFYGDEPIEAHTRSERVAILLDGFMEKVQKG